MALMASTVAVAQTRTFDIPSKPAARAIPEFARQAGVQIIAPVSQLKGVNTPALKGQHDVREALRTLVAGTGLVVVSDNGSTIILGREKASAEKGKEEEPAILDTVVVTGTRIKGALPASPVVVIGQDDIRRSGANDAGDLLRQLPQNFGGGQNTTVIGATGTQNTANYSFANSANLRGLGSDSTLTLINGQRIAPSGNRGAAPISQVPLGAIERVEVVTDGASALYGSDAVGGVINFRLKTDYDGAQSTIDVGVPTRGGGTSQRYEQLLGRSWDGGGALIDVQYRNQSALYARSRAFSTVLDPTMLIPEQEQTSAFAYVRQDVGGRLHLFGQGAASWQDSAQSVTFGTTRLRNASHQQNIGGTAGVTYDLSGDWSVSGSVGSVNDRTRFAMRQVVRLGATSITVNSNLFIRNHVDTAEASVTGHALNLPAGAIGWAFGGGARQESTDFVGLALPVYFNRDISFLYGEADVPLVSPAMGVPFVRKLSLTAAGRYEDYSDFGGQFSPKLGLIYAPIDQVTLKGTWGRSFKAPRATDMYGATAVTVNTLADPTSPTGRTIALQHTGPQPDLDPEHATPMTATIEYRPSWAPGLRLSASGFAIHYRDRITQPNSTTADVITQLRGTPYLVTNPSAAFQASVIATATNFLNGTGRPYDPSTVAYYVDTRTTNVADQRVKGVDIAADYGWSTDVGRFDLRLASSFLRLKQRFLETAPYKGLAGTIYNPPENRTRLSLAWSRGGFDASTTVNYQSGEYDAASVTHPRVASWTTIDAHLGWRGPAGWRVGVTATNLFDRDPPALAATSTSYAGIGYDSTTASPLGRVVHLQIQKDF